jgi:hypothetical protein
MKAVFKKRMSALLATLLVFTNALILAPLPIAKALTSTQETGATLKDITGHWAQSYIQKAVDAGYISGYSDNTFKPDTFINRAEVTKLIALWKDKTSGDTACRSSIFKDVPCTEWYTGYIIYLATKGIVQGYLDETFRPGKTISRAEALKMIVYVADLQITDTTNETLSFKDIATDAWYHKVVLIGVKLGLISGYSDRTFRPDAPITRAEFTKIFAEALLK